MRFCERFCIGYLVTRQHLIDDTYHKVNGIALGRFWRR